MDSLTAISPSSSTASSIIAPPTTVDRPNEHLAVLLAKDLWKPDSASNACDNFYCRVPFSIFERKHHCRKCGGVFCNACTSRTTSLLDITNLSFLHPPRNIPLAVFESPTSPILESRVCDDCFDQIHGCPTTPHTPEVPRPSFRRMLSNPISVFRSPTSSFTASTSTSPASIDANATPSSHQSDSHLHASLARKTKSVRRKRSNTSMQTSSSSTGSANQRVSLRSSNPPPPQDLERSYGELDAYPLRRASTVCKANGGGRWEPKQCPVMPGYRHPVPGGKAPYEILMEHEEELERQRKQNPIVKDGAFQYRFHKDPEPQQEICRTPYNPSTF